MFFALYIQIIRHRCVLTASTLSKQKAPPTSGALKCSFVAGRDFALVALIAHRRASSRIVALLRSSHSSRIVACITLVAWRGPESLLLLESSSNLVGDVHGAVDVLNVVELVELIDKTLNLLCIRN